MALQHAILVSLCEQSSSGYEIARRFDRSIGFFWAATHQQIYRTLHAMEDHGWVSVTEVAQHGRPDNRTRDLAVKIRGVAHGDVDAVLDQVTALRGERLQLLDTYRGFEKAQFPDPGRLTGSELHQYLLLRGGIRAEEGAIGWLHEVATSLKGTR